MDALAFDMYGTLCDPQAVVQSLASLVEDPGTVSQTWRRKQLEYSFLVSLMGCYQDFWHITRRALDYALEISGITLSDAEVEGIMGIYRHLDLYPDTREGLLLLRDAGFPMVILSNGSRDMLRDLAENTNIAPYFSAILSADSVRVFKPDLRLYQLAADYFACPIGQVWMISSNSFDAVGAKAAGMRVGWVNRRGDILDKVGGEPDIVARTLVELAQRLIAEARPTA